MDKPKPIRVRFIKGLKIAFGFGFCAFWDNLVLSFLCKNMQRKRGKVRLLFWVSLGNIPIQFLLHTRILRLDI